MKGGERCDRKSGVPFASISGVTRVGVTRCGNWWCHPIVSSTN